MVDIESLRRGLFDLMTPANDFEGRNMPLDEALELWRSQRRAGQHLLIVPARYTTNPISYDEAEQSAESELLARRESRPELTFGNLRKYTEGPMFFRFISYVQEWQDAGRIPGGAIMTVDKKDGSIWSNADLEAYRLLTNPDEA